ncbi:MAG: translation initiation factor IF-3 [bacterium]
MVVYATFFIFTGGVPINAKSVRINNQIRAREVRLLGEEGNQLGVVSSDVALRMAQEAQLDLVEIAPNAVPPVARIMDFGKYMYEMTKKEKTAKKKQHQTELKEIQIRPNIFVHDLEIKLNQARKFFEMKHKVKFVIKFRGRESQHAEDGMKILSDIKENLSDVAAPDTEAKIEGKRIFQIFTFVKGASRKKTNNEEGTNAKTQDEEDSSEEI